MLGRRSMITDKIAGLVGAKAARVRGASRGLLILVAMGVAVGFAVALLATTVGAQVQPPPAPWRGAGPTPCVGSDGGIYKCAPPPQVVAVRAGRLFDSKNGTMLTKQGIA